MSRRGGGEKLESRVESVDVTDDIGVVGRDRDSSLARLTRSRRSPSFLIWLKIRLSAYRTLLKPTLAGGLKLEDVLLRSTNGQGSLK